MWSCFRIREEREPEEEEFRFFKEKTEERHFLENGALLLEELITSFNGRSNPIRSFSKQELERATNNYDLRCGYPKGLVLGLKALRHSPLPKKKETIDDLDEVLYDLDERLYQNFPYSFYKGTYEDSAISVKKFMESIPRRCVRKCIKEVAVASKMSNHKNVLKLLGCCLETEIPTLVYEFAARGRLSDHIFEKELSRSKNEPLLSWESRLRIATEIADVVAYLHNGTSKPIIHRFINSDNILLDQHYVAKLFEFGLSISIPLGQAHVDADLEVAYFGFNAPESVSTNRFTEKSDVYSFGVVLFEILTGKTVTTLLNKVHYLLAEDNEEYVRVHLKANNVKGNTEQLMTCAELAMRCVKMNLEERPSMMEAAKELRRIRRFQHDSL